MRKAIISVVVLGLALAGATAQAGVITFQYSAVYSGGTPTTTPPWLTATLTDVVGGVEMTLQANGLETDAFVSNWFFNLDPALDLTDIGVAQSGGVPFDGWAVENEGGGPAQFDLRLAFETGACPACSRFDGSDTATFLISYSGLGAFSVASFNFPTGAPHPGIYTGAHIQGLPVNPEIPTDPSGWVSGTQVPENPVPEPGTLLLVGSGLLGLARLGRRRRS